MTEESVVVVGPDGKRWIRPADCYSCDVHGPACMWHKGQWVLDVEGSER